MWKVGQVMSVGVGDGAFGYGFTRAGTSRSCCLRMKRGRWPKPPHSRLQRL